MASKKSKRSRSAKKTMARSNTGKQASAKQVEKKYASKTSGSDAQSSGLKKSIGTKSLFLLSINAILGTGIFFLPAIGVLYAGSASLFSWIIMSAFAIFISLYFAELISLFPSAGGVYEFIKHAFGELWSFIFGWLSWVVANITIAMLIVGSLMYLLPGQSFFVHLPLAVFFILLFNFISYRGIETSTKMMLFFGIMTLGTLLFLIVPGLFRINPSSFSLSFSIPAVLLATYFISETFFGWETPTYLAEEVKNAKKVMPKVLVLSTVIISFISLLLVIVSIGTVSGDVFAQQSAPLSYLATEYFGPAIGAIFAIIVFIPLIGTASSWIVTSPRLLYAMSRDRVLVPRFKKLNEKYRTPASAIAFQTAVTIIVTFIGFGSYFILLSLLIPLVIISYSAVMLSVVKLRFSQPNTKRYFSAPFAKIGPLVIIVFNAFLLYIWLTTGGMVSLFVLGILLVLMGFPLYVVIKLQTDESFTEKFYDKISFLQERIFPVWYDDEHSKKVVKKLSLSPQSTVLEFGSGSGFTTKELSKNSALVVAVDMSRKQMKRARKKVKNNVIFIRRRGLGHFEDSTFDAVTAVGVMEHMENPLHMMENMLSFLKKGGKFCFMSFGKTFGIPGPEFLNETMLKQFFSSKGINANINRERRKMTEYWYIWGQK